MYEIPHCLFPERGFIYHFSGPCETHVYCSHAGTHRRISYGVHQLVFIYGRSMFIYGRSYMVVHIWSFIYGIPYMIDHIRSPIYGWLYIFVTYDWSTIYGPRISCTIYGHSGYHIWVTVYDWSTIYGPYLYDHIWSLRPYMVLRCSIYGRLKRPYMVLPYMIDHIWSRFESYTGNGRFPYMTPVYV